jgi:hypothetical protein
VKIREDPGVEPLFFLLSPGRGGAGLQSCDKAAEEIGFSRCGTGFHFLLQTKVLPPIDPRVSQA